jgi:hypothetical protein
MMRFSTLSADQTWQGNGLQWILRLLPRYRLLAKRHWPYHNCKQENAALPRKSGALLQ